MWLPEIPISTKGGRASGGKWGDCSPLELDGGQAVEHSVEPLGF